MPVAPRSLGGLHAPHMAQEIHAERPRVIPVNHGDRKSTGHRNSRRRCASASAETYLLKSSNYPNHGFSAFAVVPSCSAMFSQASTYSLKALSPRGSM